MTLALPPTRRRRVLIAAGAAVVLVGAGGGIVLVRAALARPAVETSVVMQGVHRGIVRIGEDVMRVRTAVRSSTGGAWVITSGTLDGQRVTTTLPEASPWHADAALEGELGSRTVSVTAVPRSRAAGAVVSCSISVAGRVVVEQVARGLDAAVMCVARG